MLHDACEVQLSVRSPLTMSGCVRVECGRLALWLLAVGVVSPWLGPGPGVAGQITQCLGTDGCRCTLDDGTVIDVSSLGNADGTPRWFE